MTEDHRIRRAPSRTLKHGSTLPLRRCHKHSCGLVRNEEGWLGAVSISRSKINRGCWTTLTEAWPEYKSGRLPKKHINTFQSFFVQSDSTKISPAKYSKKKNQTKFEIFFIFQHRLAISNRFFFFVVEVFSVHFSIRKSGYI